MAFDSSLLNSSYFFNAELDVDMFLVDDAESNSSIDRLSENFEKEKIVVAVDHDTPSGSEGAAEIQKKIINFARDKGIRLYNGRGIGSMILVEDLVKSGDVVLSCEDDITVIGAKGALGIKVTSKELAGAISCGKFTTGARGVKRLSLEGSLTGKASAKDIVLSIIRDFKGELEGQMVKLSGKGLENLTEEGAMTICSMFKKTGAYSVLVDRDESGPSDYVIDLGKVRPLVVMADNYEKIVDRDEMDKVSVNEVFLGGTAGGKIEDLRLVAGMLKGKKIGYKVRFFIAPASSRTYIEALKEGLIDIFLDAGCLVMNQGYSVDYGKSQGIVDTDEVLVSAGINNSKGNAGSSDASIYIVSPRLAAEAALSGYLGGNIDG